MPSTLHLAVLGDPIEHSRSPAIHNAAMAHLGIDGSYVARRVRGGELSNVVSELRKGSLDGANVTMPLKLEAAALADDLTVEAAASGSVNTLRPRSGLIEGHSTDVVASARAFSDERFDQSAPILILGAGGAAAAAMIGAAGRAVYVAARTHATSDSADREDRKWRCGSPRCRRQRRIGGECHTAGHGWGATARGDHRDRFRHHRPALRAGRDPLPWLVPGRRGCRSWMESNFSSCRRRLPSNGGRGCRLRQKSWFEQRETPKASGYSGRFCG